jgi:glycosyltransferase involved in cell wall biosynthesis
MKLTLGTTYYNCPKLLTKFIDHHIEHFDEIIVVDDGSSDPAENYINNRNKIRLYRVPIDYGFNSHGCRNLIMSEVSTDWTVLMDTDRLFIDPVFAVDTIKTKKLNDNTLYLFEMFSNHKDLTSLHPSVNDFLVNKNHFWKAGGYDEELVGVRTGDREYRKQLSHFGNERILYGVQAKFTRNASINLKVNSPNDKKITGKIASLIDKRMKFPEPSKKTLTFKWHRVF